MLVARFVCRFQNNRSTRHRIFNRTNDQALAEFGRTFVAKVDDFLVVVSGVDVHQRERKLARAESFFGNAQHADRVLAAGKEKHRIAALSGHLAHDVDAFGFKPVEVREGLFGESRHKNLKYLKSHHQDTNSTKFHQEILMLFLVRLGVLGGLVVQAFNMQTAFLDSGDSHHQRPERTSSPG